MDSHERATGEVGERLRTLGVQSIVAVPILIDGRVWGLFDFDRAISTKSKLRPAVCGCSGIVFGGPSCLDFGTHNRLA
jgi:GAF domain